MGCRSRQLTQHPPQRHREGPSGPFPSPTPQNVHSNRHSPAYSVPGMANDLSPDATPAKPRKPTPQGRISSEVKQAIALHVHKGMNQKEAAEAAGLRPGSFYNALMRPHVKAYLEGQKAELIQTVDAMRAPYKAQAFEVAAHLMHNADSENVKMRAVEFLAGEGKGSSVNVAVNVQNNVGGGDYAYVRPGQRMVDITPSTDTQSVDRDDQEPTE